ncbi:13082_t:CDS:2 [Cetraspora pellucida]|uniref:13082_t:CDS:1 n=1 Tax=Cetraspora pellucida TaxID=1433469 RepID=A0A9N8W1T5_9GLOM|nr:13082_t:CDS:2 [Cetraspora pellucida]
MAYYLFIHFFLSFLVLKAYFQNYTQFTQCPGQYPITFNAIYVTDPIILKQEQNSNFTFDVTTLNATTSVPIVQGAILRITPLVNGIEFASDFLDFCEVLNISNGHPCPFNGNFDIKIRYTENTNLLPAFPTFLNNSIIKGEVYNPDNSYLGCAQGQIHIVIA